MAFDYPDVFVPQRPFRPTEFPSTIAYAFFDHRHIIILRPLPSVHGPVQIYLQWER